MAWNVISFSHLSRSERKRIDAEIQIIKSLDHPRILKFISVWINREKEEVVFITERVSGGSLRAYICRLDGPLKLKVIRNWCRQILEGIFYLHSQPNPVIHRDLKCDNIFINGNDGKVLIGDLGLSTSLRGAASCATSIVGTPEFMAPELYEEKYGPPVDIYAFGMCLVEMVSRQYPYAECTTPGQIYKKVISSEKPKVLSRVKDPALRHLIEVCLDADPDNRPTAEELLADPYWNQGDDGDRLAEIAEEEKETSGGESSDEKKQPPYCGETEHPMVDIKKVPKSGVYHEEAEMRRAQAAAAAANSPWPAPVTLPSPLAPNVVVGPGDDTLILLSSPKSSRRSEDLEKSDVLTHCRRKGIERVEKVHLILELQEGKFHNVIFDFNALTDHPQIIATELRDAGLVWEGVSEGELVRLIAQSIMDRIFELHQVNTSALSSAGSAANLTGVDLLSGDHVSVSQPEIVISSSASSPSLSPPTEPSPMTVTPSETGLVLGLGGNLTSDVTTAVSHHHVPVKSALRPPLPPSPGPGSRASMDSVTSGPISIPISLIAKRSSWYTALDTVDPALSGQDRDQFLLLNRETCLHLTTPLAPSLPSGDYPQPVNRLSFDSAMPSLVSSPDIATAASLISRTASIGQSLDEVGVAALGHHLYHHQYNLANWPTAHPPLNTGRSVTGEDVRQLQAMLAVVVVAGEKRHTSFVPGVYCAFTEDTVRDFQLHNGLEITGEVDDRTWELLSEQVAYRRRKEEDRALKREEAQKKAKMEQERKLLQQKEESARAMDNIMEKTLSSMGVTSKGKSMTVATPVVTAPSLVSVSPSIAAVAAPPLSPTVAVAAALLQPPSVSSATTVESNFPPSNSQ